MSQSKQKNVIGTYQISMSAECKQAIKDFNAGIKDAAALIATYKTLAPSGGLLAAMDAANDTPEPEPELKQLGQWVFENQDNKWVSAATDFSGQTYLYTCKKENLQLGVSGMDFVAVGSGFKTIGKGFDNTEWFNSPINRETINDVDYLTDSDSEHDVAPKHEPELRGMAATLAVADEWAAVSQADLQLIFIKNMASTLLQRMSSMDRFSDDDYGIGGTDLMPWDVVVGQSMGGDCFGVVITTGVARDKSFNKADILLLGKNITDGCIGQYANVYFSSNDTYRTITADEIADFKAALEACYDN